MQNLTDEQRWALAIGYTESQIKRLEYQIRRLERTPEYNQEVKNALISQYKYAIHEVQITLNRMKSFSVKDMVDFEPEVP